MNTILKQAMAPVYAVSLESNAEGATVQEREYEIYGKVKDLEALAKSADRQEFQEQWGMPCNVGGDTGINGNIRVRMTKTGDGEPVYTQTIKVKQPDGNQENEMEISADTFAIFRSLVPTGLKKTRYFFPVKDSDLVLEVDVFEDAEGVQQSMVKIDLEVPDGVKIEEVEIPFALEDIRVIKPGIKTQEDAEFVRTLFKNSFEVSNPMHRKKH